MKKGRFTGMAFDWSPLDLILLRTELEADAVRMENALVESAVAEDDPRRKYTEEAIGRLRLAIICLSDIETERNIATHNAATEKAAHCKTLLSLDKAAEEVKQLKTEGVNLRDSLDRIMRKQ